MGQKTAGGRRCPCFRDNTSKPSYSGCAIAPKAALSLPGDNMTTYDNIICPYGPYLTFFKAHKKPQKTISRMT